MADHRSSTILLLGIVLIATALFQVSIWPLQSDRIGMVTELVVALSLAVYGWRAGRKAPHRQLDRKVAERLTLALFLFPLLLESIERLCLSRGEAFEFRVAASLRNLMIACLAWPAFARHRQFAAACSLFLVLFGFVIRPNPASSMLLAVYGCLGSVWMILFSWERIQTKMAVTSQRNIPRWASIGGLILAGLLSLAMVILIPVRTLQLNLWQIFPSSGGTGKSDPFSWRGVRDGDLLVAGVDQADSFGPVDSQVFMESDQPSLYDMFNDLYGEDTRPVKNRERAIAMNQKEVQTSAPKKNVQETATREFSTLRRAPEKTHSSVTHADTKSNALLYVPGDLPVHLSQQYYDTWDGHAWSWQGSAEEMPEFILRTENEKTWFRWGSGMPTETAKVLAELNIKVLRWSGNRLPLAPLTTAISIPKLKQADFLRWQDDGTLSLNRPSIPPHTVFSLRHELCRSSALAGIQLNLLAVSADSSSSIRRRELAKSWTSGIPHGWGQIEAIVTRLRAHCQYDRTAVVPANQSDAVDYTLFENSRATDYLYASCAAQLLRELGYQVRIVAGFYADPENYDSASDQISVGHSDVHVWLEVATTQGAWLTVDPTPGYLVQYAPPSWSEWARDQIIRIGIGIWESRVPLLLATIMTLLLWRIRRSIVLLASWIWWCAWPRSESKRVAKTWRWMEFNLRWSGILKVHNQTVRQQVSSLGKRISTGEFQDLRRFLVIYERLAYGEKHSISLTSELCRMLCHETQLVVVHQCCPRLGWLLRWFAFPLLILKVQQP